MFYYYDNYGWRTDAPNPERATEVIPPVESGEQRANWTGVAWVLVTYSVPSPAPAIAEDPRVWWIDQGPFIDRFDTHGYPGLKGLLLALGRTNDTVYAAFADMSVRKYIAIKERRAELLATLTAIAAVVAAAGRPAFTMSMRVSMLDTRPVENECFIKGL